MGNSIRVGIGYDIHPLIAGRKLILGGVTIPNDRGLDGWSDADVVTHAITEALLGAAALGDIGSHFPPGDPQYEGISSLILLGRVNKKLAEAGWKIGNVDATIITEQPKLGNYISSMRQKLSGVLGSEADSVSIKASTNNGIGSLGRNEGIAAYAVVLIEELGR